MIGKTGKFEAYFEKLEGLSFEEIDRSAERVVVQEKQQVAQLIAHLAVISGKKVDLERGYSSLFDYGVRRLGLSEGSVALRLQVAGKARRFPEILLALAENRISLSVAGRLAPHLREENAEKLLSDCAGMTTREVKEYLVGLEPRATFDPSIRARPSREEESGSAREEAPERKRQRSLERTRKQAAKAAAKTRPDEDSVPARPGASAGDPEAPSEPREEKCLTPGELGCTIRVQPP